ncbi:MAG TPA: hypothetical protein VF884_07620 [Nitrososphaeraceae archaeon]
MSIKLGHADLAKYPFLDEASVYIRETRFTIDELDRPEMDHIVNRAVNMLETEVSFGKVYSSLEKYEVEILRFLVSLLIVKSLDLEPITKKHSLFEAIRAEKFLTDDLVREKSIQKKKLLLHKIFQDLFKIEIDVSSDTNLLRLGISDYLIRATKMNEQEWKLINRSVNSGYVYLDPDEAVRLIRSELSNMIYERIKNMKINVMPSKIKICAMNLRKKFSLHTAYRNQSLVSEYPPCIKHAIQLMNRGENLPHSARLMLATYMLSLGKKIDEIVSMFQNAPDYNEKITRYQVEHLAGKKGSRIIYSVPSCKKLLTEDLCFATTECKNIINPVQFGRNNGINL